MSKKLKKTTASKAKVASPKKKTAERAAPGLKPNTHTS